MGGLKRYLLVFGILAIIFMVMPTAVARFSGQHTFVNGSNVDCSKCHPDVDSEIRSQDVHTGHGFNNYRCRGCHIPDLADSDRGFSSSSPYYNPYQSGTGKYHAAALVECEFCHLNNPECTNCHATTNVTEEFKNSDTEAHLPLYRRAKNATGKDTSDYLRGSNEACIACHTHAGNITIAGEHQQLNITANLSNDCASGDANCYKAAGTSAWWNISMEATR